MSRGLPLTGLRDPLDEVDGEEVEVEVVPVEGPSELSGCSEDFEDTSLTFHWKRLERSGDETVVWDGSMAEPVIVTPRISRCSVVICVVELVVSLDPARWSC
jgi:hypothetical protein